MKKRIRSAVSVLALSLAGCAGLPNVTVNYYLARSAVSVKVVRAVACDATDTLIVVNSATPTVTNSADHSKAYQIGTGHLGGVLTDSDITFDFYDDGRLRSINATSTGQGETILKSAISVVQAASVGTFAREERSYKEVCAFIRKAGGDKPLTLIYEGDVDVTKGPGDKQAIKSNDASGVYASTLADAIGGVCAFVEDKMLPMVPANYDAKNGDVLVRARQPGAIKLRITAGTKNGCESTRDVFLGEVPVAQLGTEYALPVPSAIAFGKKTLAISFNDAGALTSLQVVSNTGLGQAIGVANSTVNAVNTEAAQRAAAAKAEADLIVQQQRLAECLADRANCK